MGTFRLALLTAAGMHSPGSGVCSIAIAWHPVRPDTGVFFVAETTADSVYAGDYVSDGSTVVPTGPDGPRGARPVFGRWPS